MTKPKSNKAGLILASVVLLLPTGTSYACEGDYLKWTDSLEDIMIFAQITCGPMAADPKACMQQEWESSIAEKIPSLPESCQERLLKYKPAEE